MTAVRSDIEIAQAATLEPIQAIGLKLGIPADVLIPYGRDKAKIADDFIRANGHARDGKLVLVTAVSPTPAGEGKTTTTVGLGDGLDVSAARRRSACASRASARASA